MVNDADALLRDALALPVPERAGLATELLASLDESDDEDLETVRSLWNDELERRAKRALSQQAPGEDWDSLRLRLATEHSE
ncbi:MAG: addiction module protein [Ilumatobacteraceae bacterium]